MIAATSWASTVLAAHGLYFHVAQVLVGRAATKSNRGHRGPGFRPPTINEFAKHLMPPGIQTYFGKFHP